MLLENTPLFGWTVACLVLNLLLCFVITGPARQKIRWTVLYLFLFLGLHLIAVRLDPESTSHAVLEFVGLFLLLSSLGLGMFLLVTQSKISRMFMKPMPQIFIDIIHGFVYLVALLIACGAIGIKAPELFAGSALLTAVLGLSMRDTLGNLVAGLAIQTQRPFEIGDWIQFNKESSQIGQIVEINWRETKLVTNDKVEILVPNGLLAQSPIINYSRPEHLTRRTVQIHAPADIPPQRVKRLILESLTDVPGVQATPKPSAITVGFDDRGVQINVRFFIVDFSKRGSIDSAVRDRIWYALHRHGIDIPIPGRDLHVHKMGKRHVSRREEIRLAQQEKALRCVDFFNRLPDGACRQLATLAQTRVYAEQEVIVQQGAHGDELFIIEVGEVTVSATGPGDSIVKLANLGPGDFFGEMAALTGEARKATVRAVRETEVLVVGKAALARVFETSPELAAHVSQTIAQRQANLTSRLNELPPLPPHEVTQHGHHLLQRIKEFFSI
jgi:small-conductance mechanosensitive channel/CRP-like cAMP-binding protein